jgi:peptide deformylase
VSRARESADSWLPTNLSRMAVVPIRIVGDPVLHTATSPIPVGADGSLPEDLAELIADLYDTMHAANGVGLAANQIGISKRVFVYDCADERGRTTRRRGVVVNPVLETSEVPETMPDPDDDDEGCLSVPGESFPTGRADWARVTGLDADGAPITLEGAGLFARMLQHETGHLDGYLYLDRLIGRHARAAKRSVKSHGWGVPGLTWTPGEDPDPFGH